MRLKDSEKKLREDLGEFWMAQIDEFQQIARGYNLSGSQKLQYLHNVLFKDAYRLFIDCIQGYATLFQQAVAMIDRE